MGTRTQCQNKHNPHIQETLVPLNDSAVSKTKKKQNICSLFVNISVKGYFMGVRILMGYNVSS